MHDSLQRQTLSRLPPKSRKIAVAAADGSLEDLRRLRCMIGRASDLSFSSELFLPAFFDNIDPLATPEPRDLDPLTPAASMAIARAWESIQALYAMASKIPQGAYSALWPDLWKWIAFLHPYSDHFDALGLWSEEDFCLDFLSFAGIDKHDKATMKLIGGTPGIAFIIARAWKLFFRGTSRPLCRFILNDTQFSDPKVVADIVEGAGGTMADVAFIIVNYIATVVPSREIDVSARHDWFLSGILSFIIVFDAVDKLPRIAPTGQYELGPLCKALVDHRLVKALTLVNGSSQLPAKDTFRSLFTLGFSTPLFRAQLIPKSFEEFNKISDTSSVIFFRSPLYTIIDSSR
ncbi:hypothetical protein FB451DRAFT_1448421 [Mycena latifolia]|nr:hypothetical protein FB451DRAFT_1448421 [Mycena latifolia]